MVIRLLFRLQGRPLSGMTLQHEKQEKDVKATEELEKNSGCLRTPFVF